MAGTKELICVNMVWCVVCGVCMCVYVCVCVCALVSARVSVCVVCVVCVCGVDSPASNPLV